MISIDLGSNTFRCIEYDCETGTFGRDFERIVKTADGMHETGRISEPAIARIVAALKEADRIYGFEKQKVRAVTTAAMRMAENSEEVLRRIGKEGGVAFEVIDAKQEADFSLLAVAHRLKALKIPSDSFVLIDIGGGSSEVIFNQHGTVRSRSFPLGIVTVAQQCDGPGEVRSYLHNALQPVREYANEYYEQHGRPELLVATAGTPTTMAAFLQGMTYENYDVGRINGFTLGAEDCQKALEGLMALDDAERIRYVGAGRETLIVAGVVIVQMFYELLGFEEAIVIDDGVREGVAISYCKAQAGG
jgi:exopolyphosphatase/guanosine-5'-triphosphate,3'-diphosphate pyrophosphatase